VSGCLGLLGGDGVPTPGDAGPGDSRGDRTGLEGGLSKPEGAAVMVTSSSYLTDWCAVTVKGDVECWGDNESGELGDGSTTSSAVPVKVQGLPEAASQVSTGLGTACALTKSGAVWCWGYNADGELGDGTEGTISTRPVPVTGLGSGVTALSVGGQVACAIEQDGSAACWGDGSDTGLIGNGMTIDAPVPVQPTGLSSDVTSVSVGTNAACAVQRGDVLCWGGYDNNGELGNGTLDSSETPVRVKGLPSGITSVSVGQDYACALTAGGAVMCWGDGTYGALGNDDEAVSPLPVQVTGLTSGVTAIAAGFFAACAIERDGKVVCWGFGGDGELGEGSIFPSGSGAMLTAISSVPVPVKGLSGPVTQISAGDAPCAVTTSGSVDCWGIVAEYALTSVPVTDLGSGATVVTIGGDFTSMAFACAIGAMDAVECWGGNFLGQLGNATTEQSAIPVLNAGIAAGCTGVAASVGGWSACGIESGLVMCWGANGSGQLGNGEMSSTAGAVPVSVEGLDEVTAVTAGAAFACALTSVGGVYCWGDNTYGELGNGSTTDSSVPVAVEGLASGVTAVSAGTNSACALLTNGTVYCWGDNTRGELGNGTTLTSTSPGPVSGLSQVTSIGAGWISVCAVTSAGAIECWGDNASGELGMGSATPALELVPVPVSGVTSGASKVAVGQSSACAIIGGAAQCWGSGTALGIGASDLELQPVQVVGLTSGVTDLAVGQTSACAVVHGAIRCWGLNTAGQLGNGGAVDEFQATPVPGFP
jgi:alpha-tubulin suppressor-like RCC1 family protein